MSGNSTRILLFTTAYKPMIGGSEIAIEQITRRMPNVFFDIVTPWYNQDWPEIEYGDNYQIWRVGFGFKGDKWLLPILGFFKGISLFKQFKHKLIHAYQASYAGGAAFLFKIIHPRITFVLTLQEGGDLARQRFFVRFFRKLIIKKADRITAISAYLAKYVLEFRSTANVDIIPNGVDYELFAKLVNPQQISSLKQELGITDQKVVTSISRLVPKNGIAKLINAVPILNKYIIAKFVIVGSGPLMRDLVNQAKFLDVEKQIVFAGNIKHDDLPKYLALSDIFIRPSLSEGLGNVFLEAMAAGVPTIGSAVGGIVEFLQHEKTGLVCNPNDPNDIAEKMKIVLTDQVLRERLIVNGRSLIKERYTWDMVAAKMQEVYNSII